MQCRTEYPALPSAFGFPHRDKELLIGAGLFSKAVGAFQENAFNHLSVLSAADSSRSLGSDSDDASGDGPGSFDVRGSVRLDCCNANNYKDGSGWLIFGAITGWTNIATRKPFSLV